ncbi:nose resistant to fluoxetine protein 6-like isoform X2 [Culicoides brevitarsis]|uniref:nose resistant to fluoxetine protein 6-like isoform X2 n=1 Tax=Culicoides brevitarsis TaxID=469753 RepID=UPI00307B4378
MTCVMRSILVVISILVRISFGKSTICEKQMDVFLEGIKNQEPWASIMYDSWGRRPSGIYSGNTVDYGNFDQCYNFAHIHPIIGKLTGKNCIIPLQNNNTTSLYRISVCVPSVCNSEDIRSLLLSHFSMQGLYIPEYNSTNTCEAKDTVTYSTLFWINIVFFATYFLFIVITTIYGRFIHKAEKSKKTLILFSIYQNLTNVFDYTDHRKPQLNPSNRTTFRNINCLNGIRVLSTLWVIYQHTYYMQLSFPLINENYKLQWAQQWFSMVYISARVAVDNFLLISGTLISWNYFSDMKQGVSMNFLKLYLARYIRITTALTPIVLFTLGPLKYTANGPEWTIRTNQIVEFCEKYWWTALLHVQNYVNPYEVCVGQAWYLSVDFQLYLISPLILYPLWKYGDKILWIILGVIFTIVTYTMLISIYKEIFVSWFLRDTADLYRYLYSQTHVKAMPWLIGIYLGYVLFKFKEKYVVFSKKVYFTAWILTIFVIVGVVFAPLPLQTPEIIDQTTYFTVVYVTIHTFMWTLAMAWIIFACCYECGPGFGFVHYFLAHQFWQPLAKIAFCMYIVHLPFQYVMISSRKISGHFTDTSTLHAFCGDVGFAFLIGSVWHLVFECPFNGLTKYYLKRSKITNSNLQTIVAN